MVTHYIGKKMHTYLNKKHSSCVQCTKCLYTDDHPFGLTFNAAGLCSGCQIHEEKDKIDWTQKLDELMAIVTNHHDVSGYDCIVPVSGDANSFYVLDFVINTLKLNPLVTVYNKLWNTEVGIKNLALLKTVFNCDFYQRNVNPFIVKKITSHSISQYKNMYWHVHAGHYVLPVQAACEFKVNLIIWGAHEGVEQVGMFSHSDRVEMSYRHWLDHHLRLAKPEEMIDPFTDITDRDIHQYLYPPSIELERLNIRGIYLSNYSRWDPAEQNKLVCDKYGVYTHRHDRTFDIYEHVDCFNYMNIHDYFKILKFGYSKVTDHLCREIRHGRINKSAAIELVKNYERSPVRYLNLFEKWLNVDRNSWKFITSEVADEKYVDRIKPNTFNLTPTSNLLCSDEPPYISDRFRELFYYDHDRTISFGDRYITIGKGI